MKLFILCNDKMALPAVSQLLQNRLVVGVGMTNREGEVQGIVKSICAAANVPLILLSKKSLALDLRGVLMQYQPDTVLVKTFPWKIPAELLHLPKCGFFNFHYAPLPQYKGANPLFWMIKNGDKEVGVTVHKMTENYDEGPIVLQSRFPLQAGVTFGMLVGQLGFNGLELTGQLLAGLQTGNLKEVPQDPTKGEWYSRPAQKDLWIDWPTMNASQIQGLVNACNPWNKGAVSRLENGWMIGLTFVTPIQGSNESLVAGTIFSLDETLGMRVACAGGTAIKVETVYTEEGFFPGHFLAGFGIKNTMKFA